MTGQRKVELAMLAAPFAVVLVLQMTAHVRPRSLAAKPREFDTPNGHAVSHPAQNDELTRWIASLKIGSDMRSPMDHGPTPQVQVTRPIFIPTTSDPVYQNPFADAILTSVIGTGEQGLVAINGRLYRMNDQPAPDCRITFIDAKQQMVGVTLPTGEVFFIRAKRP